MTPTVPRPGGPEELDPGLARERTRLAWTRTAIAFAAVGAVVLKSHPVAGLVVIALAVPVWGLHHLFPATPIARSQSARLLTVTVTVVAVALVALALALLGQHS